MRAQLLESVNESIAAVSQLRAPAALDFMEKLAHLIAGCFEKGNKVIIAGNGGSLCDAMHFAEELTGFFRGYRKALPAIALSDPGHITCVANDASFEKIFSRGVEAYGKEGDLFIGLTTSGNSLNILRAIEKAMELGLQTATFLGKTGGALKGVADLELMIEGFSTSDRIQEAHMAAMHLVIEHVEAILFSDAKVL